MIRAFLFDFNATLIRSPMWIALEVRDLPRAAFAHLARSGYIPLIDSDELAVAEATFREARQAAERTWRETSHVADLKAMVTALGLERSVPDELIEETVAALHRRCLPSVELMPHVGEMLAELQAMGLRLGIISNAAYTPFLSWTLDRFGLLHYFEDIVVSAGVRSRKPGLEIFRIALSRMKLQSGETVYVGDDFRKDIVAAKQFGMRTIWYRPAGDPEVPDGQYAPDVVITDHNEIPAMAKKWLGSVQGS